MSGNIMGKSDIIIMWLLFCDNVKRRSYYTELTGDESWANIVSILSKQYGIDENAQFFLNGKPLTMSNTPRQDNASECDKILIGLPVEHKEPEEILKPTIKVKTGPAYTGKSPSTYTQPKPTPVPTPAPTPKPVPKLLGKLTPNKKPTPVPTPQNSSNIAGRRLPVPSAQAAPVANSSDPSNFSELVNGLIEAGGFSKTDVENALRNNKYDPNAAYAILDASSASKAPSYTLNASQYRTSMESKFNELTAEEQKSVLKLMKEGFSKSQSVEAYLACEKNEQSALTFLYMN